MPVLALTACNQSLTTQDVTTIVTHAIQAAQAKGVNATIAVTDRMGNVLAVWQMAGASPTVQIIHNPNGSTNAPDSLNSAVVPSVDAAVSKAVTAAYLSSSGGNAFSTRTASQIVQDHFNPGTPNAPSGPLYGVQFSQLACSDLINPPAGTAFPMQGVHPAPLGLSGDPGGLPLYKGGQLVGGIGIKASGPYGLDLNIHVNDNSIDETIAASGATGYPAPAAILANNISVGGILLRYADVAVNFASGNFPPVTLGMLPGGLVSVPGYFNASGGIVAGVAYGDAGSGLAPDVSGQFSTTKPPMLLVGANCPNNACQPRFPVIAGNGPDALTQAEALQILRSAYGLSLITRGQIRNPPGVTPAAVNMSLVDANGQILGIISDYDAPIFGIDVSLQKARSALFISRPDAADQLYSVGSINLGRYASAEQSFFGAPLNGNHAWSERAIGLVSRDTYPDGIPNTPNGPFALSASVSNPFADGLQLDLVIGNIVGALGGTTPPFCSGLPLIAGGPGQRTQPVLANGLQIFPGGFPIYRNGTLIGGIGVSGDGVDQDDLISFLGLYNAGQALGTGVGHAPPDHRANLLTESGIAPVYVNCPFSPFLNSDAENVCSGK